MTSKNAAPHLPENDPVGSEEELLRRVPPQWFPDPDQPRRPQWLAFKPTADDRDGLSVGRRRFVRSIDDFSYTQDRTKRRSVAQILASQALALGLTVVAEPLPDDYAHAIIPEININDYEAGGVKKRAIKEWALRIAHECAEMVFVLPSQTSK